MDDAEDDTGTALTKRTHQIIGKMGAEFVGICLLRPMLIMNTEIASLVLLRLTLTLALSIVCCELFFSLVI